MDYELFHDESKSDGYWHGMLLIASNQKKIILEYLQQARDITNYFEPLGVKKIKKRNRVFHCAQAWLSIGFASLRSKTKGQPCPIFLGEIGKYETHPPFINSKFILFREPSNFQKLTRFPDYGSKFETTFRFGIKGGAHALGSTENPIRIEKLHFDGYEHYRRHISKERIIGRLTGLREYFIVKDDIEDNCSDHRKSNSQSYEDCQFLQLTDLFIGSFRAALGYPTPNFVSDLTLPAIDLIKKTKCGYRRMQNSRWANSFWMSQCLLETDHWVFNTMEIKENEEFTQLKIIN